MCTDASIRGIRGGVTPYLIRGKRVHCQQFPRRSSQRSLMSRLPRGEGLIARRTRIRHIISRWCALFFFLFLPPLLISRMRCAYVIFFLFFFLGVGRENGGGGWWFARGECVRGEEWRGVTDMISWRSCAVHIRVAPPTRHRRMG
jgi:hypothetical protein